MPLCGQAYPTDRLCRARFVQNVGDEFLAWFSFQSKHSGTVGQYYRCFPESIHLKTHQTRVQDVNPRCEKTPMPVEVLVMQVICLLLSIACRVETKKSCVIVLR